MCFPRYLSNSVCGIFFFLTTAFNLSSHKIMVFSSVSCKLCSLTYFQTAFTTSCLDNLLDLQMAVNAGDNCWGRLKNLLPFSFFLTIFLTIFFPSLFFVVFLRAIFASDFFFFAVESDLRSFFFFL